MKLKLRTSCRIGFRNPGPVTANGVRLNYSADPRTRARIEWAVAVSRSLFPDVPVSSSSIVRLAIDEYIRHLDALLVKVANARAAGIDPGKSDKAMHPASRALLLHRLRLRDANGGGDAEIDAEALPSNGEQPRPYKELAEDHRQATKDHRKGLPPLPEVSRR